jgi:hypothetical protein
LEPRQYELTVRAKFSNGEAQEDKMVIEVLAPPSSVKVRGRIALFDPKGETGAWLNRLGISAQLVDAEADLAGCDLLIVGKAALGVNSPAPDIHRVRDGLKVLVLEQTSEALEKRIGFRVEEYGLRQVFARVPDHPALEGLTAEKLANWRGEATILPSRLKYETRPRYGVTVQWCGLPVTRLWRCGNRGNVASVLIEKPACGDFLPILDGGYSLQYSPLLEYREGKGVVVFCQLDVTGRTESEPAAEVLVRNLVQYLSTWTPGPKRTAMYAGNAEGKKFLESVGVSTQLCDAKNLGPGEVLVLGPGVDTALAGQTGDIWHWLQEGGNLLAISLDQQATDRLLPFKVNMQSAEHISAFFEPFSMRSLMAGIGPADVHNRDPRQVPLLSAGARIIGDGVLAQAESANVVFCQLAPWQFEPTKQMNLKRTNRRLSFLVSRLLGNLGVEALTPLLERFHQPVSVLEMQKRWLAGFYVDQPEEWDDPYRFFRW